MTWKLPLQAHDGCCELIGDFLKLLVYRLNSLLSFLKYLSSLLANGFGVCFSVYRFFRLLSMNDNKSAAELKASFTVVKQDSHLTTSLPLQPSTPETNLMF